MIAMHFTNAAADNSLNLALIGLVGVIITGVASFFTARFSARQATRAKELEANVSDKNADVNSWDKLVVSLQNELSRLNSRLEGLEKQSEADRKRIEVLEELVRQSDVKYRVALQYIHDIIEWTKKVFGTDELPPKSPALIASDLEMH